MGGDIWLLEEHPGNELYRHAVQPGLLKIPSSLSEGKPQTINFPEITDQEIGTKSNELTATSDAGLTVSYYIIEGPAVIEAVH